MKITITVEKSIKVDDNDNSLCERNCLYQYRHPLNPRCELFSGEGSGVEWLNGFVGIKRCQQCVDAA